MARALSLGFGMTIDDVVARTAMVLGTVVLAAVLSWVLPPSMASASAGRTA
jgi:uncharacterized YccA/Bax inhibitor family protein